MGVWAADGSRLGISDDHASTVADIAWSPDGSRIATAASGGAAFLSSKGAGPSDHVVLKGSSLLLAWQSQGRYLAVGNREATALAWTTAGSLLAAGDRSGTVAVHRVG